MEIKLKSESKDLISKPKTYAELPANPVVPNPWWDAYQKAINDNDHYWRFFKDPDFDIDMEYYSEFTKYYKQVPGIRVHILFKGKRVQTILLKEFNRYLAIYRGSKHE